MDGWLPGLCTVLTHLVLLYTGWAKKTALFLNVDNFAVVSGRKACNMSKVCRFCLDKSIKLIAVCLNILCIICINIHYPRNYAVNNAINAYFNKFSLDTEWNNDDRWSIARFNMSWLSWAQQSIRMRFCWSLSEILWWYTICCNAPNTE